MTALGCAAALTAGVVACDAVEKLTAGQKLSRAFDRLGEQRSLSVELGLDATPEQLMKISESQGEELPREAAELLAGGRISLTVQADKPLNKAEEADFTGAEISFSKDLKRLMELRIVGETTYVRADIEQIAEVGGEPAPSVEELTEGMPAELGFVEEFLEGGWVSVNNADLEELDERMSEFTGEEPKPGEDLTKSQENELLKGLKGLLGREVGIKDKGRRDGADHLEVSASARSLLGGLVKELEPLSAQFPGEELPTQEDLKAIPTTRATADVLIKDGKLSEVTFDLAQLDEEMVKAGQKLPLRIDFAEGGPIEKPSGATEVPLEDVEELMESFSTAPWAVTPDELSEEDFSGEEWMYEEETTQAA
ncbi:hypothetical protein GCM10027168_59260 [Streptomyces capparidis]